MITSMARTRGDILRSGAGFDKMEGGGGNDTYVFNRGDGADNIYDDYRYMEANSTGGSGPNSGGGGSHEAQGDGGVDALVFGPGIKPSDVVVEVSGDNLKVWVRDPAHPNTPSANLTDHVTLQNGTNPKNGIETLRFADGASINLTAMMLAGTGGDDSDRLYSVAGAQTIDGGTGVNTMIYRDSPAAVDVNLATGINRGGDAEWDKLANIQNLTGSAYNDTLTGDHHANVLKGGSGDDTLDGGMGADALDGGAGNNTATYATSTAGVTVNLLLGTGAGGTAEGDSLAGIQNLVGSDWSDRLTGDDYNNVLRGGLGSDTLLGGAGNDTLHGDDPLHADTSADWLEGGAGFDVLTGGAGNDTMFGGADGDSLYGGAGNDTLRGDDGDDWLYGDDGTDALYGGAGDDHLYGGAGSGTLLGDAGNDWLLGGDAADWLDGGDGFDLLDGGAGDDTMFGRAAGDVLLAAAGNDWMEGNEGADTLHGGAGFDVLNGGTGNDILTGGSGSDSFVFAPGFGADIITDFAAGPGSEDRIDLSAFAGRSLIDLLKHTTQVGTDAVIDLGGGDSITLQNVSKASLNIDDFTGVTNKTPNDFNGDARTDLLFFNDATGGVAIWQMNGTQVMSGAQIGAITPGWHFTDTGDFNGDGKTDLLFLNDTTHGVAIWQMSGFQVSAGSPVGTINAADGWHYASVRDFNGDARADLLFLNDTTPAAAVWQMNGIQVSAGAQVGAINAADGWHYATSGDFNGDGKADLLFLNDVNRGVAIWQMDGTHVAAGAQIGSIADGWHFADTGDFNGDGKSELLFLNDATRGIAIWQTDGSQVTAGAQIGTITDGWHYAHTGDFNGDARTDLLFLNDTTHGVAVWQMNGTQVLSSAPVGTVTTGWHFADVRDYNADGKSDLLFLNDATHGVAVWQMDGLQVAAALQVGIITDGWHITL